MRKRARFARGAQEQRGSAAVPIILMVLMVMMTMLGAASMLGAVAEDESSSGCF